MGLDLYQAAEIEVQRVPTVPKTRKGPPIAAGRSCRWPSPPKRASMASLRPRSVGDAGQKKSSLQETTHNLRSNPNAPHSPSPLGGTGGETRRKTTTARTPSRMSCFLSCLVKKERTHLELFVQGFFWNHNHGRVVSPKGKAFGCTTTFSGQGMSGKS